MKSIMDYSYTQLVVIQHNTVRMYAQNLSTSAMIVKIIIELYNFSFIQCFVLIKIPD